MNAARTLVFGSETMPRLWLLPPPDTTKSTPKMGSGGAAVSEMSGKSIEWAEDVKTACDLRQLLQWGNSQRQLEMFTA